MCLSNSAFPASVNGCGFWFIICLMVGLVWVVWISGAFVFGFGGLLCFDFGGLA